ncbi:hypothetical protein C0431_02630 [bacterium]|nr:hypothetical protein [bacterium]
MMILVNRKLIRSRTEFIMKTKPLIVGSVVLGMTTVALVLGMVLVKQVGSVSANVQTIEVEGNQWSYIFSKPAGKAKGLILAMHGGGGSGPQFDESAQWSQKATAAGFAVVLPTGLPSRPGLAGNFRSNPHVWNSGQLNSRSPRTKVDDLAALEKILARCQAELGDVPFFVSGHSNGAGMSFRVASEWPDKVRAVGIMSGNLHVPAGARGKKPIPTLWIVGEKDPLTPFAGGTTKMEIWGTEKENRPVLETATEWAKWNGFQGEVKQRAEREGVREYRYGNVVWVWECLGHGHAWPGGKKDELPESIMGPDVTTVDATSEIVKFFGEQLRK